MQLIQSILLTFSLFAYLCWGAPPASFADAPTNALIGAQISGAQISGAQIFEAQCAGCHAGGGNIVRRGKTLKLKALQKNQMDNLAAIQTIVTQGKGNMSAYGDRLSAEEINAVAAYVLAQAAQNWPTPSISPSKISLEKTIADQARSARI
jgi:cytochrome c6